MQTLAIQVAIGLVVGLILGWNVIPQPAWVEKLYNKVFGR